MPRAILLPLFGDLGDTVLWVPAVRALRKKYPDTRLVVLCKPLTGRILADLGLADRVIDADKHLFDRSSSLFRVRALKLALGLIRALRAERIDMVVLLHHLVTRWGAVKFAALSIASGARERIGLDNGRGWFLTSSVRDRGFGDRHEAQYWLDVARAAGACGELVLEFPVSAADRVMAAHLVPRQPAVPLIAIHPGTGPYGPGRQWPADRFARTARLLQRELNATVVMLGTSDDREAVAEVMSKVDGPVIDLCARTSIGELGAVLERCDVLIANDGGVAHVSAAVGTPPVTVFGPSNARAWAPLEGTVVRVPVPCQPCFYRDFERGKPAGCATRECLALVTPATVAEAVRSLLGQRSLAG